MFLLVHWNMLWLLVRISVFLLVVVFLIVNELSRLLVLSVVCDTTF